MLDADDRRRAGKTTDADGDGARRTRSTRCAAHLRTPTSSRRSRQGSPRDGAARAHRQGRGRDARRHPAPGHAHRFRSRAKPDESRSSSRSTSRALEIGDALHVSDLKLPTGVARSLDGERRGCVGRRRRRPRRSRRPRLRSRARRPKARRLRPRAQRRRRPQARRRLRRPAARAASGAEAAGGASGSGKKRQEVSRRCGSSSGWAIRARVRSDNRHNIGFMVVDELARRARGHGAREVRRERFGGESRAANDIVLLQAAGVHERQRAGGAAGAGVLQDRADRRSSSCTTRSTCRSARFKLKVGGGHGGHNGLRSIIASSAKPDFVRVRCGVGKTGTGGKETRRRATCSADFSRGEADRAAVLIGAAADAVEAIVATA